jgi:hypothetical protein
MDFKTPFKDRIEKSFPSLGSGDSGARNLPSGAPTASGHLLPETLYDDVAPAPKVVKEPGTDFNWKV